jgi:hypothetical protein
MCQCAYTMIHTQTNMCIYYDTHANKHSHTGTCTTHSTYKLLPCQNHDPCTQTRTTPATELRAMQGCLYGCGVTFYAWYILGMIRERGYSKLSFQVFWEPYDRHRALANKKVILCHMPCVIYRTHLTTICQIYTVTHLNTSPAATAFIMYVI